MAIMLDFPHDLLVYIAKKVDLFKDIVALGGACKAWLSAAMKENFSRRPQIPRLMLAQKEDGDNRGFYSLSKGMIRTVTLPEANEKQCKCLASEGWLITKRKDLTMNLLHPLSRVQIRLPPMSTLEEHEDFTYTCSIWKLSATWHRQCLDNDRDEASIYLDPIYFNGHFYAVDAHGRIFLCDVEGANPTVAKIRPVDDGRPVDEDNCNYTYGTTSFQVFEVDLSKNGRTEVKNLGHRALFLGHSSSFSIEASHECIKADCIYFVDDCEEAYCFGDDSVGGGKDMRIYNLQDRSFTPHFKDESYSRISPPMWVAPSF
ncbi:hypothetical protein RJ639_004629 [Escallonia herrerae]|uniref:KIB1-4 beta-propeller domain-containing protein n=1 Tax=Escallonia herrerae TaxID=1293975 RepID=A0AA88W4N2_9ASTE|nr:hypothetical protein RJ639_004629 [Escallonia herrerae]